MSGGGPALDGRPADRVASPSSAAECAAAIIEAAATGHAVVPWGGGTAIAHGNRLRAERWTALRTRGMAGVHEYSPDDLVITAGAGTTLAEVQSVLSEHRQFLPIDPRWPERATLGGLVATNAAGRLRAAYGATRDRLLGFRAVLADGTELRGGGKVVKNVAGYDLCRLLCGSWGTLGAVTEATFRVQPLPPVRRWMRFGAASLSAALGAAVAAHRARLQPAALAAVGGRAPALIAALHGAAALVKWQERALGEVAAAHGLEQGVEIEDDEATSSWAWEPDPALAARAALTVSALPGFAAACEPLAAGLVCDVASGVVEARLDIAVIGGVGGFRRAAATLAAAAGPCGSVVWPRVPPAWRPAVDVWGPGPSTLELMRAIKQALDPGGMLSPGRFVGGL